VEAEGISILPLLRPPSPVDRIIMRVRVLLLQDILVVPVEAAAVGFQSELIGLLQQL
jgi:hypothetical protein